MMCPRLDHEAACLRWMLSYPHLGLQGREPPRNDVPEYGSRGRVPPMDEACPAHHPPTLVPGGGGGHIPINDVPMAGLRGRVPPMTGVTA